MTARLGKPISRDWSLNLRQKSYHLDPVYLRWISWRKGADSLGALTRESTPVSHVGGGSETESKLCSAYKQELPVGDRPEGQ